MIIPSSQPQLLAAPVPSTQQNQPTAAPQPQPPIQLSVEVFFAGPSAAPSNAPSSEPLLAQPPKWNHL